MTLVLAQDALNEAYLIWGFVLFAAAFLLVVLELFIPSGGIIGGMAAIAAIGSIAVFFMYDTVAGLFSLGAYVLLAPIVIWGMFKFWLHSPMAGYMILGGPEASDDGDDPMARSEQARIERLAQLQQLIGAEGVTVTSLRPVGIVKIEGQRVDALAETGTIEAGVAIVVTDVYDNQIKVRPQ